MFKINVVDSHILEISVLIESGANAGTTETFQGDFVEPADYCYKFGPVARGALLAALLQTSNKQFGGGQRRGESQ